MNNGVAAGRGQEAELEGRTNARAVGAGLRGPAL